MKYAILIILAVLLCNCAANKNSYLTKKEATKIEFKEAITTAGPSAQGENLIFSGISTVIPAAIEFSVKQIDGVIKKEANKYTAEYSFRKSTDDFYLDQNENPNSETMPETKSPSDQMRYASIEIQRDAADQKGVVRNMLRAEFEFKEDLSNKLLFLAPKELLVTGTKAKLNTKDSTVDIVVNIKITSFWLDKGQKYQNKTIADMDYTFKDVILEKRYTSEEGFQDALSFESIYEQSMDYFPPIPVSLSKEGNRVGYGNFRMEVNVIETDEYSERLLSSSEYFKGSRTDLAKFIGKFFD